MAQLLCRNTVSSVIWGFSVAAIQAVCVRHGKFRALCKFPACLCWKRRSHAERLGIELMSCRCSLRVRCCNESGRACRLVNNAAQFVAFLRFRLRNCKGHDLDSEVAQQMPAGRKLHPTPSCNSLWHALQVLLTSLLSVKGGQRRSCARSSQRSPLSSKPESSHLVPLGLGTSR